MVKQLLHLQPCWSTGGGRTKEEMNGPARSIIKYHLVPLSRVGWVGKRNGVDTMGRRLHAPSTCVLPALWKRSLRLQASTFTMYVVNTDLLEPFLNCPFLIRRNSVSFKYFHEIKELTTPDQLVRQPVNQPMEIQVQITYRRVNLYKATAQQENR